MLLVVGLIAWAALAGGGDNPTNTAGKAPTGGGSSSPTSTASSPSPSPSPSSSPPAPTGATADGMESFIKDYLATVTTDPKTAWEMLTPSFQQASEGYGHYQQFWKTIDSAQVTSIEADPVTQQVHYSVDYVMAKDQSRTSDDVLLHLVYKDGNYLIDSES